MVHIDKIYIYIHTCVCIEKSADGSAFQLLMVTASGKKGKE